MLNLEITGDRDLANTQSASTSSNLDTVLAPFDAFPKRHIGPDAEEINQMLATLGINSIEELIDKTVPPAIRLNRSLKLPHPQTEYAALAQLKSIASKNQVFRSFIGMGYYDCITPPVIQRNILENPGWYTAYTPYQAEIAQGRLEALLNFQTMIAELTGLEIANASLLDEGTAAAEAMGLSYAATKRKIATFFVSSSCHPQTIEVVKSRANPLGIEVIVGDYKEFDFSTPIFGALLQYPASDGTIHNYRSFIEQAHEQGALVTMAADPLESDATDPSWGIGRRYCGRQHSTFRGSLRLWWPPCRLLRDEGGL